MRTRALVLLLCWSSLALAIEGPSKPQRPGLQSTLRGTNSQGYNPWVEQVTGLTGRSGVGYVDAVDARSVWASVKDTAANEDYRLIRTTDGGTTWICDTIDTAPADFAIQGICALDASRCWVAMYDASGASGGGVFHTTNSGATWTRDPATFKNAGGWADFIHFFDAEHGVCVGDPTDGYFEIYTTSDGGATWSRVPETNIPPQLNETGIMSLFSAAGNSLWFPTFVDRVATGRFYRTTDRGLTWSVHLYPGAVPEYSPVVGFEDDNVGLGSGNYGEMSRTTDGGSTWARISFPENLVFNSIVHVPGTSGMYVGSALWKYPSLAEDYLYGTAYTVDGGVHWTMACELDVLPTLDFVSASAGWGACFGPNIGTWTMANGRVIGASVESLEFDPLEAGERSDTVSIDVINFGSEPVTLSGIVAPSVNFTLVKQPVFPAVLPPLGSARVEVCFTPQGDGSFNESVLLQSDATNAPALTVSLEGRGVVIQPALPGVMYAASASRKELNSLDLTTGVPTIVGSFGTVSLSSLAIQPHTWVLYGALPTPTTTTLYRVSCANGGALPVQTFPIGNMRAIVFDSLGTLYGATTGGRLYRLSIATKDTFFIGGGAGIAYASMAFSPSGTLFASVRPTVTGRDRIYTVNASTGVATLVGSTGDNAITPSITFGPDGTLYGLKGIGAQINTVITIDTSTGAGTQLFSTGMQGLDAITMISIITSVSEGESRVLPRAFALYQNYPNPFNPSTTIRYGLPERSYVTLIVYNALGQQVTTLVQGEQEAGHHEVAFDARTLASGMYLYRLTAGSFVQTRKLLLVH